MLKYRLIFGPIMIAAILLVFWGDSHLQSIVAPALLQNLFTETTHYPPGLAIAAFIVLIAILPARELTHMFAAKQIKTNTALITLAAIATAMSLYLQAEAVTLGSVIIATFALALIIHTRKQHIDGSINAAAATLMAGAYLGATTGCFLAMRHHHSAWTIIAIILITKASDTGAYFTGKAIGKHKLIPWLSPGKTWEGLIGGIALAILAAVGFAALSQSTDLAAIYQTVDGQTTLTPRPYAILPAAFAGAIIAIVATLGDLTISLFKRDANIKDSGAFMPGFGGKSVV